MEVMGTTPRMGRRSMALADIDPKYVSQSGIWEATEMETSRGSIRIQHLTAVSAAGPRPLSAGMPSSSSNPTSSPRFPKLEECAHFHYDSVELPTLKIFIRDDPSKSMSLSTDEDVDRCAFSIEVVSGGQCWAIRRTHANLHMLDEQLHRCVWDRNFSLLEKVENNVEDHDDCKALSDRYFVRLTELPTNKITCGTVLSWLELDNRGRHIVSSDDSAINTPAVAAACAVRKYTSQAADEISFDVGEMISVIDMPPPEESVWWRGKRGFHVGFFPRENVQIIGDKLPIGLPIASSTRRLQRLSVSSNSSSAPAKPVLRKHGKLIAFFRSFILSRPSRRRLKQSGILRERVFSCDLAEHLLNTGSEIPAVLKCCSEFIEHFGIVDGIYRLSGITSNIQKLRNSFDEDKVPNLAEDEAIKQDIHAVSSLLKMYFRELPNPLCTYQLYEKFVIAAQSSDEQRLFKMREVVHELPPPHYRTLEYLMKHLARVAMKSSDTGMTPKNMAIVWAPNLIRCKELEAGGVAALKGIGVQAVVTEYLVRHADLIFNEKLPANFPSTTTLLTHKASGRPKSLAISSPIRLMSLEEAQDKAKDDRKYIEVGGGPSSLPPKYHTVIELPSRRSALKNKRSPIGWRTFFSRNRSFSNPKRKSPTPCEITIVTKNMSASVPHGSHSNWAGRLRPVKSVESLVSSPLYQQSVSSTSSSNANGSDINHHHSLPDKTEGKLSKSSPATPVTDVHVVFHLPPEDSSLDPRGLLNPKTHNRSISHDSYFEFGEFRNGNNVYIDETLEEETMSQSSKLSLDISGVESNTTSLKTEMDSDCYGGDGGDVKRRRSRKGEHNNRQGCSPSGSFFLLSPKTPPPSAASVQTLSPPIMSESITSVTSVSSDECANIFELDERALSRSPLLRNQQRSRPSKWVESDDELLSPCYPSQNISENIESCNLLTNNTTSIKNNSNYKPDLTFEQPSDNNVEFRRSQISVYSSESKYELDRNSSVDESSADSTPGEVTFATTNIIYSPLVNEFHSPSSCGGSSKISRDSSATSSEEMGRQQAVQIQTCKLFICPLYEAGINVTDIPPDPDPDSPPTVIDTHIPNMHETFLSNNKVENNVKKTSFPPYENIKSPKACMDATTFVPTDEKIVSTATAAKITDGSNHLYENNHVYQNEVFATATLRETTPDNNTAVIVESYMKADEVQQLLAKSQSNDSIIEEDDEKQDEQIYSEHYENIKENEDRSEVGDYEANIYEDIDEDENVGNSQDAYHDQNSYETVQVFGSGAADGRSNSSSSLSPPLPSTNCIPSQSNSTNAIATLCEDNSDAETEAAYESVQFHANTNHHHYAEIHDNVSAVVSNKTSSEESPSPPEKIGIITSLEKSTLNSPEDSSSQSHSHTEDVVTYLDTPAPCLKLRADSLEEPNQIKEDGEDGEFKLNSPVSQNSNSFRPSQTSPSRLSRRGSDEDRDEDGGEADNGEIRHIDSPVLVDNPLYGIQIDDNEELRQENNNVNEYNNENEKSANLDLSGGDAQSDNENDNDISMNESISISVGMDVSLSENGVVVLGGVDEGEGQGSDGKFAKPEEEIVVEKREKLLGRCNSAPLAETVSEFALAASSSQGICVTDHDLEGSCVGCSGGSGKSGSLALVSGGGSSTGDDESSAQLNRDRNRRREHYGTNKDTSTNIEIMEKLILCKRLSEPSLLFSNNTKAKSDDKCAAAAAAWKIADAKRLANRKQSVKELLSKFETNDRKSCSPVMTSTSPVPGAVVVGHGLPRHDSSSSRQSIDVSSRSLGSTNTTGGRFQHHRFSMGDILMTQSVSAAEDLSNIKSSAVMIRSDTFPELRTPEASKQMSQTSSINTQSLSENISDSGPVQVTEKVQQALRVAMSSVDMNDPSTRERIEKYKEERRMFLRQKINSDLSSGDTNVTKSSSDGSKGSQTSLKSPDFSVSSAESVFGSNCKLIAPEANSNSVVRSTESPRKRAFSEDIPPYANQTKTIKTESVKSSKMISNNVEMSVVEDETKSLNTTGSGGASPEEINVREKVALWSLQKTAPAGTTTQSTGSFAENVQKTKEDHYNSMIRVPKPILKEASSLPTEGFVRPTTVLRREVTTSSIEINKSQFKVSATNSKTESGKKIKDMAAFFERKQF